MISGAASVRPELEAMLADAHAGRFSTLVVWSLDRLSRRRIAEVAGIVAKLDACGVALVSVREPWRDSSGIVRDLLVAVMAWVAEQERARLLERLAAARARLEADGRSWGRPRRLSSSCSGASAAAAGRPTSSGTTTRTRGVKRGSPARQARQ